MQLNDLREKQMDADCYTQRKSEERGKRQRENEKTDTGSDGE